MSRLSRGPRESTKVDDTGDYIAAVVREAIPIAMSWEEIKTSSDNCDSVENMKEALKTDPMSRLSRGPRESTKVDDTGDYIAAVVREAIPIAMSWEEIKTSSDNCDSVENMKEALKTAMIHRYLSLRPKCLKDHGNFVVRIFLDRSPMVPQEVLDTQNEFYGYLSQQQNMMQDSIRTSTYQRAMLQNVADFQDKVMKQ
ncbi:predicted protein [Nematostella vectensis]|uniref:Uncharacterized protein n=1 Tax=Nematostella vectensis TaxID=45351 RepID=A7T6N1_NEMVE|nr:predicted protein [Nematostella vectensis]|eukprot:XP_001620474.1 hypothetical protein NEMVEDRAFT_v1g223075 [Nematostella vectensis]